MEKYDTIAKGIYNALNSTPINTSFLINTVKLSDNLDRQFIRESYYKQNTMELMEDLKCLRTIEGKSFECLLIALFRSPAEYDVYEIQEAVDGAGTNEDVLSEILGTREPLRIKEIKRFYSCFFLDNLENVIEAEIKEKHSSKEYLDFLGKILLNEKLNEKKLTENELAQQRTTNASAFNNLKSLSKEKKFEFLSKILLKSNTEDLKNNQKVGEQLFSKNFKNSLEKLYCRLLSTNV